MSKKMNRELYKQTQATIEKMVEEYNAQGYAIPERITLKVKAVLDAETIDEAVRLQRRALDSALTFFLAAWANKKIPGRITELNVEGRAKKAENLADYLDSQGLHEQAKAQRQRADELRAMVAVQAA